MLDNQSEDFSPYKHDQNNLSMVRQTKSMVPKTVSNQFEGQQRNDLRPPELKKLDSLDLNEIKETDLKPGFNTQLNSKRLQDCTFI